MADQFKAKFEQAQKRALEDLVQEVNAFCSEEGKNKVLIARASGKYYGDHKLQFLGYPSYNSKKPNRFALYDYGYDMCGCRDCQEYGGKSEEDFRMFQVNNQEDAEYLMKFIQEVSGKQIQLRDAREWNEKLRKGFANNSLFRIYATFRPASFAVKGEQEAYLCGEKISFWTAKKMINDLIFNVHDLLKGGEENDKNN